MTLVIRGMTRFIDEPIFMLFPEEEIKLPLPLGHDAERLEIGTSSLHLGTN